MISVNTRPHIAAPVLGLFSLLFFNPLYAGDIVLKVEEPQSGSIMTGVSNIRGWAVSSAGIDRIELYMDGDYKTDIPSGGIRKDVGRAYPDYPESDNSGFSMANNYSLKSAGEHVITIKAYDNDSATKTAKIPYSVTRFEDNFIKDPTDINIFDVSDLIISGGRSITMRGVDVQGSRQDIRLDWQTPKQNFSIASVLPSDQGTGGSLEGVYTLSRLTFWFGLMPDIPAGLILDTEAESTTAGGISFSATASGSLTVEGSVLRTSLKYAVKAAGTSETIDETWQDTLIDDDGFAITYRDSAGDTFEAILLQRGTQMIWLEHMYGPPEVGDGVMVVQWQKAVEKTQQAATSSTIGTEATHDGADSASPSIWDSVSQSVSRLLRNSSN
jgi:hypothetical protein